MYTRWVEGDFIDRLLASYKTACAPAPAGKAPAGAPPTAQPGPAPSDLTSREIDVLELLSQRLQNKEIAAKLYISTHTVNDRLKHIYQKLGVRSRRQAVRKAQGTGLLPTPAGRGARRPSGCTASVKACWTTWRSPDSLTARCSYTTRLRIRHGFSFYPNGRRRKRWSG